MCTVILSLTGSTERPVIVAGNRDERLDRPAVPPLLWPGRVAFVAPRDERAGGTWLGLNEHGLFVGLTNRAGAPPDPSRRSRGLLVTDSLMAASAGELDEELARLDPRAHGPFHLVYADRQEARLAWIEGEVLRRERLRPGVHIVTERSAHPAGPRADLIRRLWPTRADLDAAALAEALRVVLSQHAEDPFEATCIHADALGYGTRSSFALLLGASWTTTHFFWAEGKPCQTSLAERPDLIRSLEGVSASRAAGR